MLQRKKYFVVFALLFCATLVFSQRNSRELIYLKNGSVIRGMVIEQIPGKSIKIRTTDRNVLVYSMDEVEKIEKVSTISATPAAPVIEPVEDFVEELVEEPVAEPVAEPVVVAPATVVVPVTVPATVVPATDATTPVVVFVTAPAAVAATASVANNRKAHYKGIVEFGYLFDAESHGFGRLKMDFVNGIQINPYFSIGVGIGWRYYTDAELKTHFFPLYADFRTNIIDNNVSPYISLGIGYSFGKSDNNGAVGLLLQPAVGISIKMGKKSAFNLAFGYEMQKLGSTLAITDAISLMASVSF